MARSQNKFYLLALFTLCSFYSSKKELLSHNREEWGYLAVEISKGKNDCRGNSRITENIWYVPDLISMDSLFNVYILDESDVLLGMNEQLIPNNTYLIKDCSYLLGFGLDTLSRELCSESSIDANTEIATHRHIREIVDTMTYHSRCFLVSYGKFNLKLCSEELKGTKLDKARNVLAFKLREFELRDSFFIYTKD